MGETELFNNLPIGVSIKDVSLRYQWANDEWLQFIGVEPDAVLGLSDRALFTPPCAQAMEVADLRSFIETQSSQEIVLTTRNGTERAMMLHRVSRRTPAGELDGLTTLAVDITASQDLAARFEILLGEMDVQRSALHEHALVTVTDPQGVFLYASTPMCALLGYSQAELNGRSRHELGLVPAEDYETLLQSLRISKAIRFQIHARNRRNEEFWLESLLVPLGKPGEAGLRYFEISTDITAIKRTEERLSAEVETRVEELRKINAALEMDVDVREQVEADLRHQNALIQSMLTSMTQEILLLSGKGLLLQTNKPWDAFSEHEAVPDTLHAAIAGDNFIDHCRTLSRTMYHDLANRLQQILDGGLAHFEFNYEEMAADRLRGFRLLASAWIGEERGIIITQYDTTESRSNAMALEKRNGELLQLNEQLQDMQHQLLQSEKMASIGQLAAGIAHEINNPIGYVNSNLVTLGNYLTDLLRLVDVYDTELSRIDRADTQSLVRNARAEIDYDFMRADIDALLGESKEGISRVKRIVQDLKDFSRIDSTHEWGEADLHAGIDSTLNIVHNEIKYKADVIKEYSEIPPVECIISQLNQVFLNMLVNAGHAIDKQGVVRIKTWRRGHEVCIAFSDNGSGIPAEIMGRIFDPFFTTKPVGQGTGLGLSLSYGIVQKHHGRIELTSEPGVGTTFEIWLPIRQPSAA